MDKTNWTNTEWESFFKEKYKHIDISDIAEYIKKKHPEKKADYKKMVDDGESFFTIKKTFFDTYFPQLIQHIETNKMKKAFDD